MAAQLFTYCGPKFFFEFFAGCNCDKEQIEAFHYFITNAESVVEWRRPVLITQAIETASVQNLHSLFCCVLKKTLLGTFHRLTVLTSSSKFQSYF